MKRITSAQIRKLHAISRERGIDDDLLHEHIRMLTDKDSMKDLTCNEAILVIDSLEGKAASCKDPASYKQIAYIRGLLKELRWVDSFGEPDMERLNGMCRKYAKVDHYKWLDKGGASNIIEALKNMLRKQAEKN